MTVSWAMAISKSNGPFINVVDTQSDKEYAALNRFCSRYGIANINIDYDHRPVPGYASHYYQGFGQQKVSMTLSKEALDHLVRLDDEYNYLRESLSEEREIRRRSLAAQKAWEDYQLLLKLSQ